jgi:flagellar hook-associated protein FlgK
MSNGMVNVSVNGHWLVDQGTAASITTAADPSRPGLSTFTWSDNGQTFTPDAGAAAGGLELRDQDIAGAISNLNQLASSLQTDYNGLQASGYAAGASTPGGAGFFTGTSAQDFQDPALAADPSALATAQTPNAAGDGTNATAFAALSSAASPGLGMSYTEALSNWTTEVGASAALATQQQTTQQAALTQLNNLTSSVSGVDMNQQAISLSQYQQAYEAGAKYVGTLDTMMQSLFMELAY